MLLGTDVPLCVSEVRPEMQDVNWSEELLPRCQTQPVWKQDFIEKKIQKMRNYQGLNFKPHNWPIIVRSRCAAQIMITYPKVWQPCLSSWWYKGNHIPCCESRKAMLIFCFLFSCWYWSWTQQGVEGYNWRIVIQPLTFSLIIVRYAWDIWIPNVMNHNFITNISTREIYKYS